MADTMSVKPRRLAASLACGFLALLTLALAGANPAGSDPPASPPDHSAGWQPFEVFRSPAYSDLERLGLVLSLLVAAGGLAYASVVAPQIKSAAHRTQRLREIAQAGRQGSNPYLR